MHGSLLLAIIILTEDFAYSTVSVNGAPFSTVTNTNGGNIVSNQKKRESSILNRVEMNR